MKQGSREGPHYGLQIMDMQRLDLRKTLLHKACVFWCLEIETEDRHKGIIPKKMVTMSKRAASIKAHSESTLTNLQ